VLKDHKVEKADNLKVRAAYVPDYMQVDVGDYDEYLASLRPSQLQKAEARDAAPPAGPEQ
jgi:hypothetical protein